MSPLKKFLDRLTGSEVEPRPLLRAFGKLPESREFLQLEAGRGAPKLFQNWVKAGHDQWVTVVPAERRGTLLPCRMWAVLPEAPDHAVVAHLWRSQDSAKRVFPFTFFVVLKTPRDLTPLPALDLARRYWAGLEPLFAEIAQGQRVLQSFRDCVLDENETAPAGADLITEAQNIPASDWFEALSAGSAQWKTDFLSRLRGAVANWRAHPAAATASIRVPLSRRHDYTVQAAAWIRWLETQHPGRELQLTALALPAPATAIAPAVALITRPLREGDFQLLTSDAPDYEYLEDLDRHPHALSDPAAADFEDGDLAGSLWDWANRSL